MLLRISANGIRVRIFNMTNIIKIVTKRFIDCGAEVSVTVLLTRRTSTLDLSAFAAQSKIFTVFTTSDGLMTRRIICDYIYIGLVLKMIYSVIIYSFDVVEVFNFRSNSRGTNEKYALRRQSDSYPVSISKSIKVFNFSYVI